MLKDSTAVIGLGLGGMTVTYEFQERNYLTYSVNGSEQDIKSIPNAKNSMRLEGYDGLAGNRELAYGALKGNKHILKKLKEIEKKIIIVIASAGGSTGSGCIPFVSDILVQNLDKIVVPVILMNLCYLRCQLWERSDNSNIFLSTCKYFATWKIKCRILLI